MKNSKKSKNSKTSRSLPASNKSSRSTQQFAGGNQSDQSQNSRNQDQGRDSRGSYGQYAGNTNDDRGFQYRGQADRNDEEASERDEYQGGREENDNRSQERSGQRYPQMPGRDNQSQFARHGNMQRNEMRPQGQFQSSDQRSSPQSGRGRQGQRSR